MPISVTNPKTTAGQVYPRPFIGRVDDLAQIAVPITALTSAEVDIDGYLKPGVPLTKAGALVTAGAVWGVTIEPIKVATGNTAPEIAAAGTKQIGIAIAGSINRKLAEDCLGRVYTAAELAGFDAAGSTIKLQG